MRSPGGDIAECPACAGHLFVNTGLRLLVPRDDHFRTRRVAVCSACLLPIMREGRQLIDVSSLVNVEEIVRALIQLGHHIPDHLVQRAP